MLFLPLRPELHKVSKMRYYLPAIIRITRQLVFLNIDLLILLYHLLHLALLRSLILGMLHLVFRH